ncbi:MAG: hypothetical protein ACFE7E_04390 [Candidatus Hodarchaeota archaeon]
MKTKYIALIIVAIVVPAAVVSVVLFLPTQTVEISQNRNVPYQSGVEILDLTFWVNSTVEYGTVRHSEISIGFESMPGKLLDLNISINGTVGMLAPANISDDLEDMLNITFDYTILGNVLTVTSAINASDVLSYLSPRGNITCSLLIDPSLNTTIDVLGTTAGIGFNTQADVVIDRLSLITATGGVAANLVEDTIITGNITIITATGGVNLNWQNLNVTNNIYVNITVATGGISPNITQTTGMLGNVTLDAVTATGGIDFDIDIEGAVGAWIESSVVTGGISTNTVGFTGTESPLQSNNYPDVSNFIVDLSSTTGGISVDASYTP